jgi:HK97 family phage prohead protease
MKTFERRMAVSGLEVRDEGDDLTLTGYASTFNQSYDMGWYQESVDPGAFKRTLGQKPDVRFLINHDGLPLARTTSGTLSLATDDKGLIPTARLNRNDPDVAALLPKIERGDLNQMSFAFRILEEEWEKDMSKRTLRSLDLNGGDVSVVTFPANPHTSVGLRMGSRQAIEAMSSALLALEKRGADEDDFKALLARMQRAFGDESLEEVAEAAVAEAEADVEETSEPEGVERALSRLQLRKRQLALLQK